jgi:hypothetical protein
MRHLPTIAALSLLVSACAPLPIVDRSQFQDHVGSDPAVGQRAEAPTGGLMFSQYSLWLRSGARITVANRQPFGLGGLFIGQGEALYPATLDKLAVYCSDKRVYSDPIAGFTSKACFADTTGDGVFDQVQVAPESTWVSRPLSPPLPYKRMDIPVPHRGSFKYELAYDGYGSQTLHLSYREFRGKSLDRPTYTQQVKYEVKAFPAVLTFREVKIEVLQADNNRIVYSILRGF